MACGKFGQDEASFFFAARSELGWALSSTICSSTAILCCCSSSSIVSSSRIAVVRFNIFRFGSSLKLWLWLILYRIFMDLVLTAFNSAVRIFVQAKNIDVSCKIACSSISLLMPHSRWSDCWPLPNSTRRPRPGSALLNNGLANRYIHTCCNPFYFLHLCKGRVLQNLPAQLKITKQSPLPFLLISFLFTRQDDFLHHIKKSGVGKTGLWKPCVKRNPLPGKRMVRPNRHQAARHHRVFSDFPRQFVRRKTPRPLQLQSPVFLCHIFQPPYLGWWASKTGNIIPRCTHWFPFLLDRFFSVNPTALQPQSCPPFILTLSYQVLRTMVQCCLFPL